MADWKVFIGGAGDHEGAGLVQDYYRKYKADNPRFACRYFGWPQGRALHRLLLGEALGGHVTLVGHSLGANTAFFAMGHVPTVDVLISIDPVGPYHRSWTAIRAGARVWLNMLAKPTRGNGSDVIAGLGRRYGPPPAPPSPDAPNYAHTVPFNHGDFGFMLVNRGIQGVTGGMLLGGKT